MFNTKKITKIFYLIVTISLFCSTSYSQKMVYGYYPSWVETKLSVDQIDYDGLTHIIHAFIYPDSNGVLKSVNDLVQSNLVNKAHEQGVKVLVSIGGAEGSFNPSEHFHTVAKDPVRLENFINNVSDFLTQYNYDGIDLDWEQPSNSSEKESLTKLVKALRVKFDAENPEWLLTMATFASDFFHQHFDYAQLVPEIDYFLVMAYNYCGSWLNYTSHSTPLVAGKNATDGSVSGSLLALENKYKVPREKLIMGVGFYGWQYKATQMRSNYNGNITSILYNDIEVKISEGDWKYFWDEEVKAPYVVNETDSILITYDDSNAIKHKAEYVIENNYPGVMIWALSYDLLNGKQPLVEAVKNVFKYTSIADGIDEIKGFKLFANYPNPFNPSTKISFEIPERSYVELKVFNLTGEEVGKIFIGELEAGTYEKQFNASYLSSGIYYYRLTSGTISLTKKMMLVK